MVPNIDIGGLHLKEGMTVVPTYYLLPIVVNARPRVSCRLWTHLAVLLAGLVILYYRVAGIDLVYHQIYSQCMTKPVNTYIFN